MPKKRVNTREEDSGGRRYPFIPGKTEEKVFGGGAACIEYFVHNGQDDEFYIIRDKYCGKGQHQWTLYLVQEQQDRKPIYVPKGAANCFDLLEIDAWNLEAADDVMPLETAA